MSLMDAKRLENKRTTTDWGLAMKLSMSLILGLIVISMPLQADAYSKSAGDLLRACERDSPGSPQEMADLMHCAGYLDGMLDFQAVLAVRHPQARLFCAPPGGISLSQARRVFVEWAQEHPEQLHESARVSVVIALSQAFPCEV